MLYLVLCEGYFLHIATLGWLILPRAPPLFCLPEDTKELGCGDGPISSWLAPSAHLSAAANVPEPLNTRQDAFLDCMSFRRRALGDWVLDT
ncbi:hypothetical protein JHW43_004829 [Diplocarpon mali]|nr:hypothetical protein JHW43_004829 [Diplocarpon mali]